MEWVVALAVGLAICRWAITLLEVRVGTLLERTGFMVDIMLTIVAVVEAVALIYERGGGRGPRVWGPGRWIWMATGLYCAFHFASLSAIGHPFRSTAGPVAAPVQNRIMRFLVIESRDLSTSQLAPLLLASLSAFRCAGWRSQEAGGDMREWSGRVFAALVVGWSVVWRILSSYYV
jgi:hypothetical protein